MELGSPQARGRRNILSSLRATAAPLWEFDVGGTSLQASFRHDFAGSRHDFTAFSTANGAPSGRKSSKNGPNKRSFEIWGQQASPRASPSRPRAAKKPPKSPQEDAKRAKLTAKRVPEEPQGVPQGAPEGPRESFLRSETQKNRSSSAIFGVTRSRSALEAISR